MASEKAVGASDLKHELQSLPDWTLAADQLEAAFKFPNFRYALAFMNMVGMECEALDHHPEWTNSYDKVRLRLCTHSAGSKVTQLDLTLARYVSKAARDLQGVSNDH